MTDINIKGEIEAFLASLKCKVTEHDGIMVVETPSGTAWDFTVPQLRNASPRPIAPVKPVAKPPTPVTPVVRKGTKPRG